MLGGAPSLQITGPEDADGTNGTATKSFQQNPVQMAFQVCSQYNFYTGFYNFNVTSLAMLGRH